VQYGPKNTVVRSVTRIPCSIEFFDIVECPVDVL
jgi:hypothetical protein